MNSAVHLEQQVFADSALRPGSMFAERYKIHQLIGHGTASSVYRATDRITGDVIAIKVVPSAEASAPNLQDSFHQEVLIARKLSHPNVVRIFDIGDAAGVRFISMELLDASNLAAVLNEKGKLPISEFLSIFRQLWTAIEYVHANWIIHRDIKLHNLMLAPDGTLKLMDFGVRQELGATSATSSWNGKADYVAPEIAAGGRPSPLSDIYAAGVVCLELLALGKPSPDRSRSDLRMVSSEIPDALVQLLKRCVESDPRDRPESATVVLAEASSILKGAARAMSTARTLFDLIADEPAHTDIVLPLLANIARKGAELPPNHAGLSPESVWINLDGSIVIHSTSSPEAKYLAPALCEQASADDARNDASEKVYVLGFIFFEVLVGRRIFNQQFSDVLRDSDHVAWFEWHGNFNKVLPVVHKLVPDCSIAVSDLVAQMLQKKPEQRPANLAEVAARLEEIGASLETPAVRKIPQARHSFWTVRKVLVCVAAVCFIALAIGWHYWPRLWSQTPGAFLNPQASIVAAAATPKPDRRDIPASQTPAVLDTSNGKMVLVAAADFVMGNDNGRKSQRFRYANEAPAHKVHVDAFYIDVTEVRNAAFAKFCHSTGHPCPANPPWDAQYFNRPDYPVINVSWNDAQAFCAWAGKGLPTEAEWERAAGGLQHTLFPWGNSVDPSNLANLKGAGDGFAFAAPVGSFPRDRSSFGVLDMAGNVPEWTADDYSLYPGNASALPAEERSQKVIRGAGFMMDPEFARTTNRASASPTIHKGKTLQVGFRCAVEVKTGLSLSR